MAHLYQIKWNHTITDHEKLLHAAAKTSFPSLSKADRQTFHHKASQHASHCLRSCWDQRSCFARQGLHLGSSWFGVPAANSKKDKKKPPPIFKRTSLSATEKPMKEASAVNRKEANTCWSLKGEVIKLLVKWKGINRSSQQCYCRSCHPLARNLLFMNHAQQSYIQSQHRKLWKCAWQTKNWSSLGLALLLAEYEFTVDESVAEMLTPCGLASTMRGSNH